MQPDAMLVSSCDQALQASLPRARKHGTMQTYNSYPQENLKGNVSFIAIIYNSIDMWLIGSVFFFFMLSFGMNATLCNN